MRGKIKNLVDSLRQQTIGRTCMGTGNFSFDVITQREYPDGFVIGKRNRFEEKILKMEIGNTCGNVMTMLPYLGVKTFPLAMFDVSPQGYQMKRDMKAYGADVRFVRNTLDGGTTILRCVHKLDKDGILLWGIRGRLRESLGMAHRHVQQESISRVRVGRWIPWLSLWTLLLMFSSLT